MANTHAPAKHDRRNAVVQSVSEYADRVMRHTISRDSARGIPLERVDKVIKRGLENGEESQTSHGQADNRSNPRISGTEHLSYTSPKCG